MVDYKRNHVVPVSHLKRFRSLENNFFYFNVKNSNTLVKHRNPKNVFWYKDFYVSKDANGCRDTSLESEVYNKLETDSKKVFDKVITSVRKGDTLSLTSEEIDITQNFIANQMMRSPEFQRGLESGNDDIFQETMNKLERTYGLSERLLIEKDKSRMLQTAKCDVLKSPLYFKNTYNAIKSKGVFIGKVEEQSWQFLIGSNPCARFQFEGDNLGSPLTKLFLPISYDVVIILGGAPKQTTVFPVSGDTVLSVNKMIASKSDEIAGASYELVCKYAEEMKGRVKLQ